MIFRFVLLAAFMFLCAGGVYAQDTLVANRSSSGFISNRGQIIDTEEMARPELEHFISRNGVQYFFTDTYVALVQREEQADDKHDAYAVKWSFKNQNPGLRVTAAEKAPNVYNYYLAHCPDGIAGVEVHNTLRYTGIYDDIDLIFEGDKALMDFAFALGSTADYRDIRMAFSGSNVRTTPDGQVEITTVLDRVYLHRPVGRAFVAGKWESFPVAWTLNGSEILLNADLTGVAGYDDIVIESSCCPQPLPVGYDIPKEVCVNFNVEPVWSSYLGSTGYDYGDDVEVDGLNALIGVGASDATDFPYTYDLQLQGLLANYDLYIARFHADRSLDWITVWGGRSHDLFARLAINSSNNIIIAARTLRDLPWSPTPAAYSIPLLQAAAPAYYQDDTDCSNQTTVIGEFNSMGGLLWATLHPGNHSDVVVDSDDNIFITGTTSDCSGFSFLDPGNGAYYSTSSQNDTPMLLQFSSAREKEWCTAIGQTGMGPSSLAVNSMDAVYIAGSTPTGSLTIVTGDASYGQLYGGGPYDWFIMEFSQAREKMWATYIGGSGDDRCQAVAIDGNDGIWLTGSTNSSDFPTLNPGGGALYNTSPTGTESAMVKFTASRAQFWGSLFGGSGWETGFDVSIGRNASSGTDKAFVIMQTASAGLSFPTLSGWFQQTQFFPGFDALILRLSTACVLEWASYFGGNGNERPHQLWAINDSRFVFCGRYANTIAGYPYGDLPLVNKTGAYYDGTYNGGLNDAFFTEVEDCFDPPAHKQANSAGNSVSQSPKPKLVVYPNPVKNGRLEFEVSLPAGVENAAEALHYELLDLRGATMVRNIVRASQQSRLSLDVSTIPQGVYLLRCTIGGLSISRQVVVQ